MRAEILGLALTVHALAQSNVIEKYSRVQFSENDTSRYTVQLVREGRYGRVDDGCIVRQGYDLREEALTVRRWLHEGKRLEYTLTKNRINDCRVVKEIVPVQQSAAK
jgi:hypothetical protein